jgi:hypothetical protein
MVVTTTSPTEKSSPLKVRLLLIVSCLLALHVFIKMALPILTAMLIWYGWCLSETGSIQATDY